MHLKRRKPPKLEFRSEDQAWYDVCLQLKGRALKIHYAGFSSDSDELLRPEEFRSVEDVRSRFRFSSEQLQDQQCGRVTEGMAVCASCSSDGEDIRFFDAVVEQVYRSNHCVDSKDDCRCAFVVFWLAGPHANERTTVYCENICLLTPGIIETHPVINALVKLVEEKTDCRTQSVGRNPLRKNVESSRDRLHVPGSVSTNFESNQGEQGQTTMEVESSCDLNKLRKLNEQKDKLIETIEEASTNANEEGNWAFAPETDCAPDFSGPVSSQHKEKQGKSEQVNATEKNHNKLGKLNKQRNMAFDTSEEAFSNPNEKDDQSVATKADRGPHFSGSISSQHKEKQGASDKVNATEKDHTDEALLINVNKGVEEPLGPKTDCAKCFQTISSQSKERQKKSDGVDFAERIFVGREALLQELFVHDNENECFVKGVSDIGSDTNMSSHLHRDTDIHPPKQHDDYGKMTHCDQDQSGPGTCSETNTCSQSDRNAGMCLLKQVDVCTKMRDREGESNACMKDSIALGSSLSSYTIQDEIISKSSFDAPIDAATIFIQGKEKHFSSVASSTRNSCEPPVCAATIVSECKRTHLDTDAATILSEGNHSHTDAATILSEGKGTDFNSIESLMRKEVSPCLPDLNSIPVDLEMAHPCIPTTVVGINSNTSLYSSHKLSDTCIEDVPHAISHNSCIFGNNINLKDKRAEELDDNYGVIENERSCYGGFLESEDYDNPSKEDTGCQVVQSGMACKSSNLIVDGDISIQNKGHKLLKDHEVTAYGGIEMLSSGLVPVHQDEGYDCERPLEISSRQNAMFQETTENLGRKVFLASSWGKGKRQKLRSTEMFINNERLVQGNMQNDECLQAWEKLASPKGDHEGIDALRSNGSTMPLLESHKRKKPLDGSADFCDLPDKILKKEAKSLNSDEVDFFQSSCLAASHLESQKRQEAVNISANLCDLPDQICRKVDEIGNAVCCHGEHTKQVLSFKMQSQKIVPEVVVISSDSESGHDVQDTISVEKGCYNAKDFGKQQKRHECSNDLLELDKSKNGQLNCCSPYRVHSKECGDFAVHSPNVFSSSGSAEGDLNINREKDELCEVGNCKHSNKFMKSRKWSKRENERIQKVTLEEDGYNCMKQGVGDIYLETDYGHGNEDMRANQSWFSSSQVLMLDNLERDVDSLDILAVISQATHGVVRVCIMPSLKYERFTRGFVFFKDRASWQRAVTFLQDNNFLIVSSKGRPWVVHHEVDGVMQVTSKAFAIGHEGILPSWTTSSSKFLIVRKGTREYEKAKMMKDLFLEFREHVTLLHKRTEHEESMVLL